MSSKASSSRNAAAMYSLFCLLATSSFCSENNAKQGEQQEDTTLARCPDYAGESVRVVDVNHCAVPRYLVLPRRGCPTGGPVTEVAKGEQGAVGFVSGGVRPDSIYAKCGFRNGDVWRDISGVALTSPEQALRAYALLRKAPSITVSVLRGGRSVAIRMDLLDSER
jgi:hypothetical protein